MFQVIERGGERKAVYSQTDLDYMRSRGWTPVAPQVAALLKPAEAQAVEEPQKRKYTRKAKA